MKKKIEMKKRKIYIAGPMTGRPGHNREAFMAAERRLEADGWEVVNPVRIAESRGTLDEVENNAIIFGEVMAEEERVLRSECDAIYLLRGWERSAGAKDELFHAIDSFRKVILERGGE